ncbi:MATE family multidrug resistance protein [Aliiruegeria haliotis]|uniref:Multidrug-efflux transporter n=1 Tax=Aliiruegeria haliotis TaxID=1280846 RepID=A0A2T0RVZ5_9RHOB|nr:MATE family efflux transporter [Aliiruegeria haliotis]PRY25365.1 MATE family multidrug resistance protein [Aliiruegeria haliotis]
MSTSMSYLGHARALLTLGVPLIGGHLAQFAIQATDTIMLGWYDVEALAAVVLAGSLFFTFFIMGSGFAFAVMPMVAAATENEEGDAHIRRVTRMGLWISLMYSALAMPIMIWSEPILLSIGQPPEIAQAASQYLSIAGWGMIPALGVMALKSYLSALEKADVVLWVTILAAVVNALVNYLLIFGSFGFPELGIRGAAIASVTVHVTSLVGLMLYAIRAFPQHELFVRFWRPDWVAFAQVFKLGWPISLTNLSEVGLFAFSAVMVGWLGTIPLAAHGIALQLASATFLVHLGLSNATTIRAGKAFGRGEVERLKRGAEVAIAMSILFAAITIAIFLTWPEELLSLFLDPDDPRKPEIIAIGVGLMAMAALFQLFDGGQVIAHGLLRGIQDTRVPMFMSAAAYWPVGITSGYLLGFTLGYGAIGVWAGLVFGLLVANVLLMWRFWRRSLPRLQAQAA